MELFVETHVRSEDRQRGVQQFIDNRTQHFVVCSFNHFISWIEYDDFFFNFQETYNSRLRERYGDDPSTHPELNLDLWMEEGSFGGPNKKQVYGLSNTMAENLQAARSVSTVGSSQSVSSTQSQEFVAL
jgi:hypothetical protein